MLNYPNVRQDADCWAITSGNTVNVTTDFPKNAERWSVFLWAIHEMAHSLDSRYSDMMGYPGGNFQSVSVISNNPIIGQNLSRSCKQRADDANSEVFADAFVSWVVGGPCAFIDPQAGSLFDNIMKEWLWNFTIFGNN